MCLTEGGGGGLGAKYGWIKAWSVKARLAAPRPRFFANSTALGLEPVLKRVLEPGEQHGVAPA
jgi:hypothetical protein